MTFHLLPAHRMISLGTEVTVGRQVGFGIGAPAPGVDLPLLSEIPELGKSSALPSPAKSRHPDSVISYLKLIRLWQTASNPSEENSSLPHSPYSTSVNVI